MPFDILSPTLLILSPLFEDPAPAAAGDAPSMLPLFAAFAAIFWFVMIKPERKSRKKREEALAALEKGDKVMMKSGLYGTIIQLRDEVVTLQVADGVRMKFAREAIQGPVEEADEKHGKEEKGGTAEAS